MTLVVAGALYLALGFLLWVHAWAEGASTHTLCGCGDPALFLWFFQWPATALSHGQNPFFSTALFHPHGINLLSQTSVTGLSVPLVPVTWIWGPVASLNVASTITPALTAFTAFFVIRRWVSWTPAAFVGGLLYGFSPFVLSSLEFAHLMTAALMLLPLILAALDEILVRQRRNPLWAGALLAVLLFAQFFLSSELLAIVAVVVVICVVALVVAALVTKPSLVRARFPYAAKALAVGLGLAVVLLAWPVWFALKGPASLSGLVWPNVGVIGGFIPSSFVTTGYPPRRTSSWRSEGTRVRRWPRPRTWGGASSPSWWRASWPSGATAACGSSASSSSCAPPARWASAMGSGSRRGCSRAFRCSRTSLSNASWRWATWPRPSSWPSFSSGSAAPWCSGCPSGAACSDP